MKPKICHFLGGQGMGWTGGIKATLKSLEMSWLAEKFEFITAPLSAADTVISQQNPDVMIVHAASSWRGLLPLWKLHRRGKLIINEHHYCAGFEAFNVPSAARFHTMLKLAYGMGDSHRYRFPGPTPLDAEKQINHSGKNFCYSLLPLNLSLLQYSS